MATSMAGIGLLAKEAGEDLSNALFLFASLHSDGKVYKAGAGAAVLGVVVEGAVAGASATVQYADQPKITLAATLNAGDRVMSDASGKAVAVINSPPGNYEAGMLLAGGVAGDIVPILLNVAATA